MPQLQRDGVPAATHAFIPDNLEAWFGPASNYGSGMSRTMLPALPELCFETNSMHGSRNISNHSSSFSRNHGSRFFEAGVPLSPHF